MTNPTMLDRLGTQLVAVVRNVLANLSYFGRYECTVQAVQADGTVDVAPTDTTLGLVFPNSRPLKLPAMTATLVVGQVCHVQFLNGSPARPVVVSVEPTPLNLAIDATALTEVGASSATVKIAAGVLAAARTTDTIEAGSWLFEPTIPPDLPGVQITYTPTAGIPVVVKIIGLLTIVPATVPTVGRITSGSTKVLVG